MPGRDGTGPQGQGAMTGRCLGVANNQNQDIRSGRGQGLGQGQRSGQNQGTGNQQGCGLNSGAGRNQGTGRGRGRR